MKKLLDKTALVFFSLTFGCSLVVWGEDANNLWTAKFYAFILLSGLAVFANTLSSLLFKNDSEERKTPLATYCYIAFLLIAFFEELVGDGDIMMNRSLVALFLLVATALSVGSIAKRKQDAYMLIVSFQAVCIVQSIWAVLQLSGVKTNLFLQFDFGGALGNPNILATYLATGVSLSLGYLLLDKDKSSFRIWVSWLALLIGGVFVVLAGSRAAWISVFVSTLIILSVKYLLVQKYWLAQPIKIRVFIITAFISFSMASGYFLYQLKPASANGRLFIWKRTFEGIADKPLTGSGIGSFYRAYNNYQGEYFKLHPDRIDEILLADVVRVAYNEFFNIGLERGLIGLAIFLAFLFFVLQPFIRKKKEIHALYAISAATLIGLVFNSIFSYTLYINSIYYVFVILIAICVGQSDDEQFKLPGNKWLRLLGNAFLLVMLVFTMYNQRINFLYQKEFASYTKTNKKKQTEEVFQSMNRLEERLYNDLNFANRAAAFYMGYKKYTEVVDLLTRSAQYYSDPNLFIILGDAYYRLENYNKAEKYYEAAMHIRPILFRPRRRLVMLYGKVGRLEEMCEFTEDTLEMPVKVASEKVLKIRGQLLEIQQSYCM